MGIMTVIGKEAKALAPLFGPLLVSQYAQIAAGIVDTAMTAQLGVVEVGSVAVGVALWMPLNVFIVGILYACLIFVSQLFGAGKPEEARRTVQQGMWLGVFLGIAAALTLVFLSRKLVWFGADAELVPGAGQYVRMLVWGLPFMYVGCCIRFYSDGQGIVAPFTGIAVFMVLINAFLNYCLIFGNFGFPRMELEGCGLATGLSMFCFFLLSLGYITFAPRFAGKRVFTAFSRARMADIRRILATGLPIGLNFTSEFLIFSVITLFISARGAAAAAAHQVTFSAMMFFFALPGALSIALSIRVGTLHGGGDRTGTRRAVCGGAWVAAILGLVLTGVMFAFAEHIALFFTQDQAVVPLAAALIRIAAVFQVVDAMQVCLYGTLRGAGDTAVPFLLTAGAYWLFCIPLGYVLSGNASSLGFAPGPEVFGVRGWWLSLTAGLSLVTVVLMFRVRKIFWKTAHAGVSALAGPATV